MIGFTSFVGWAASLEGLTQNLPNLQGLAILRDRISRSFPFRPKAVYDALVWLKANNVLYKHVSIVFPAEWGPEDEVADATTLIYDEEDVRSVLHSESANDTSRQAKAELHNEWTFLGARLSAANCIAGYIYGPVCLCASKASAGSKPS